LARMNEDDVMAMARGRPGAVRKTPPRWKTRSGYQVIEVGGKKQGGTLSVRNRCGNEWTMATSMRTNAQSCRAASEWRPRVGEEAEPRTRLLLQPAAQTRHCAEDKGGTKGQPSRPCGAKKHPTAPTTSRRGQAWSALGGIWTARAECAPYTLKVAGPPRPYSFGPSHLNPLFHVDTDV